MKLRKFISWKYLLPLGIFVLALCLRLYRLSENSPAIYADEAGHFTIFNRIVNQDTSIFKLAYDKLYWPTFTLTWIFGLNPLGVRVGSAIYGSLFILAFYLLVLTVHRHKYIAFVSVILASIMPWSYMISRIGHTHIPIITLLTTLHVFLLVKSKNTKQYLVSLIPLLIGIIYYPSMIIVGMIGVILNLFYLLMSLPAHKRHFFIAVSTFFSIALFIILAIRFQVFSTQARGLELAIWRDVNTPYDIDKYRALSWNSKPDLFSFGLLPEQLANKFVYNRVMANLSVFTRNYLSFFSPYWLFLHGDDILRHSTGQVGELYPFLAPFMLYGAFKFFQIKDKKTKTIFLIWILASPIPAAITKDGAGYLLRVVTMLPFLTYFCALGVVESFGLIHKKLRWPYGVVLALIGLYSAFYFFYGYFHVYPSLSEQSYEFGFKELSSFQTTHQNATMLVIWDGYYHNMDFRFWQYTPYDQYLAFKMKRLDYGQSIFWQTFPNLYFSAVKSKEDLAAFIKAIKPAYVVLPDRFFYKYPEDISLLLSTKPAETILYPDQTPALTVYTIK